MMTNTISIDDFFIRECHHANVEKPVYWFDETNPNKSFYLVTCTKLNCCSSVHYQQGMIVGPRGLNEATEAYNQRHKGEWA